MKWSKELRDVNGLLNVFRIELVLNGEKQLVNRAYAVYVALDDEDKPAAVPAFLPETEEERQEYAAALERRNIRLGR